MHRSRSMSHPLCRALSRRRKTELANLLCGGRFLRISASSPRFSSSAFPDWPIPDAVRRSVKSSILSDAASDNHRWWRSDEPSSDLNGHDMEMERGGVDVPISNLPDPLNDLYLEQATVFWPELPDSVQPSIDPFQLARPEVDNLARSIREDLIGTDHPVLNKAASYFFSASADSGKKIRPMMVLLLSRALSDSFTPAINTATTAHTIKGNKDGPSLQHALLAAPFPGQRADLPQAQRRLAEISELIHTASLFHDDVIDGADTRRGIPAVHMGFGNKMAILAGDYLLARASICLARLRDVRVVETMSTIIEHLVRGEVMQMRGTTSEEQSSERIVYYLRKNYYKTASLMANSCKSAALLGDYPDELVGSSYRYGKHVGMAFQLVDDVLDFEGNLSQLGKPSLADLTAGLATAPVLFAAEEFPSELGPLIDRKFGERGDVDRAVDLVFASRGIERTKDLARVHAEIAMQAVLDQLNPSVHRDSLVHLAHKVVARTR